MIECRQSSHDLENERMIAASVSSDLVVLRRAKVAINFSANGNAKQMVAGLSWVLIAGGGILFLAGGRALHEFVGINRAIAEVEGLVGAVLLFALGIGLRAAAGLPLTSRSRRGE
jgi:hypothetical protein